MQIIEENLWCQALGEAFFDLTKSMIQKNWKIYLTKIKN